MSVKRRTLSGRWIICLALALCSLPLKIHADAGAAIITGLAGGVLTARAGQAVRGKAETGLTLFSGDMLRTGENASATLLLGDGQKLNVLPNSTVKISTEMGGERKVNSGLAMTLKSLWAALVGKFAESGDITRGIAGTMRGPIFPLKDKTLFKDDRQQLDEQVALLELLEIDSTSRHLMIAVVYERAEQYARAEANYLEAIELSPDEGRLYDALGFLYVQRGQKEQVLDLAERKSRVTNTQETGTAP